MWSRNWAGWMFVTPIVIGIAVFTLYPMIQSFVYSFYNYQGSTFEFDPGVNFAYMFGADFDEVLKVFGNTFLYGLISVPLNLCLSYLLAVLVNQKIKGVTAFRVLYYLPVVIPGVVSGVMTSCAASKSVDGLLTDQKAEFGNEVIRQAQAILDGMEMGVSIVSLEFKSIKPPSALQYHFDQVNAASVEKETRIQQANQYRERVIPEANAAADTLVSDAQVSQHDRINRANDQVAEFYGLFQEYQQNRDVVYERVFREKVVTIFNQMGGKIVLPEGTNTPQIFLP